MRRTVRTMALAAAAWLAATGLAAAADRGLCAEAVAAAEAAHDIPGQLLAAMALTESRRWMGPEQASVAWPWTVYAEGRGRYYDSKPAAVAAVEGLRARGVANIDVGCLQVNLHYHAGAFASLDEAFDPWRNADYAARFLTELRDETRSWSRAAGYYHSRTPDLQRPYQRKVMRTWQQVRREQAEAQRLARLEEIRARRAAQRAEHAERLAASDSS